MRKYRYFESDPDGRYKKGRQCIEVVHDMRETVGVQLAHQGWYVGGQLTPTQARTMAAALVELADEIDTYYDNHANGPGSIPVQPQT